MTFIVRKEVVGSTISCIPISGRFISIRISARPHNIRVIQVYAPTSDHEYEEVEQFYEQLDSIIAKTPKKDIFVIQGDWNAKVGPDANQHWAGTVGRFGIGEANDRGDGDSQCDDSFVSTWVNRSVWKLLCAMTVLVCHGHTCWCPYLCSTGPITA